MPGPGATKKASKSKPALYDAGYVEDDSELFDPNTIRAADKKRGRNAGLKKKDQSNGTDDTYAEEVTRGLSASPNGPQSMLGQIPYSFPRGNSPADVVDVLAESVKVSDQYSTWAQDVPYGKSPPGNSVAGDVIGESPPVQAGYMGRGGFNTKTSPRSPSQRKTRPVSFGGSIPPVPARQQSEYGYRHSPSNYGSPPALPHLPQQHFYAAQDINLGLNHQQAREDTQRTFMAFRELPPTASRPAGAGRSGVFIGSNGRLDILAPATDQKYVVVGALCDLVGDVIDAMPLTWYAGKDPFCEQRPLIAVAIHAPANALDREASDTESIATGLPIAYHDSNLPPYETRVEVYSLKEQQHITTLLRVPDMSFSSLTNGNIVPEPAGDLRLDAFGNHLIISSGVSGEVFVCGIQQPANAQKIECLAKYWTNVQAQEQRRDSSHSRSPRAAINDFTNEPNSHHQSAIYSGYERFLAICPPGPIHRPTLSAQVTKSKKSKGSNTIDSRNPPARPSTTCAVESPDVETLLGTIARGAAQQVAKGASWVGNQGLQAWNSYWSKDHQQQPQSSSANPPYPFSPRQQPQQGMFPPTHASEPVSREPDVVWIIDLKTLSTHTTFQPPKGCSFLSFMPSGLVILTASKKGDVQYVWDLKQVKYVASVVMIHDGTTTEAVLPRVRQVAKFERITPSTIVDVIWEPALGERFALVTKKGTIHLFDLPQSAFRFPPPRRQGHIRPATAPSNPVLSGEPDATPVGGFLVAALNIASKAPDVLGSLRGRAPSMSQVGATGVSIASAAGARGTQAVAHGFSKSLGAAQGTMQHLRHAGDARLHVDSLAFNPATGMIAFGKLGEKAIISILDKGSVKSYYISKAPMRDKRNRLQMTSIFRKKTMSFRLPHVSALVARGLSLLPQGETQQEETQAAAGFWPAEPRRASAALSRLPHPLSRAEVESNAPYQPFLASPGVNVSVYNDPSPPSPQSPNREKWVFGEDISATMLNTRSVPVPKKLDDEGFFEEDMDVLVSN